MSATLTIHDETTSGRKSAEFTLDFLTERITVRELIRSRVYQEVQDYNQTQPEFYRGLIQPTDTEQTLNGFKARNPKQVDWKLQYEAALTGFEKNAILILVGSRQAESLNEEIEIKTDTRVTFLKLTPLVGG